MATETEDYSDELALGIANTIKDLLEHNEEPRLTSILEVMPPDYLVADTNIASVLKIEDLSTKETTIKALSERIDKFVNTINIIPFEKFYEIKVDSLVVKIRISSLLIKNSNVFFCITTT